MVYPSVNDELIFPPCRFSRDETNGVAMNHAESLEDYSRATLNAIVKRLTKNKPGAG